MFGTVSFKYKTQAEWRTGITQAVNNFKAEMAERAAHRSRHPDPRAEQHALPDAAHRGRDDRGPAGAGRRDGGRGRRVPGLRVRRPEVQAHSCSEFQGGGPHLTAAGNMANVPVLADYFVQTQ